MQRVTNCTNGRYENVLEVLYHHAKLSRAWTSHTAMATKM